MSYVIGFFAVILKFIAFMVAMLIPAYLLEALLKAIHLHVIGVLPFAAFLGLVAYSSNMQNIVALTLCVILILAWIACIVQVRGVPKDYFQMDSVKSTVDLSWACLYAFGIGSLVATIPAIEAALPWQIDGFIWYVYVCLAMFAVMPIMCIKGTLEDIHKLDDILNERTQIDEDVFIDMVHAMLKDDDSEDDAKKKAAFIQEYLRFRKVALLPSERPASEAEDSMVPTAAEPAQPVQSKKTVAPVEINSASEHAFRTLPHFGLALAKKAVQRRQELGSYQSIEDFCIQLEIQPHLLPEITPYLECTALPTPTASTGRKIEF